MLHDGSISLKELRRQCASNSKRRERRRLRKLAKWEDIKAAFKAARTLGED